MPPLPPMSLIEPGLFLGNLYDSVNFPLLAQHKIGAMVSVLDLQRHPPMWNYPENRAVAPRERHLIIDVQDHRHANLLAVLVDCFGGMSRSSAAVIAYLMRKRQQSEVDVLANVQERRSIVHPNSGFLEQLHIWRTLKYEIWDSKADSKADSKPKPGRLSFGLGASNAYHTSTHLVELAMRHKYFAGDRQYPNRAGHLYKREMYLVAREMVDQAISPFEDINTLAYASAIDLGGLVDLDIARAAHALQLFKRALEIRKSQLGPEDPFIAYSLNNISLIYTEMGELELAYETHQEATKLRFSDRIGKILQQHVQPSPANEPPGRDRGDVGTGALPERLYGRDVSWHRNPRFSGDMVLLSRIRLAQGRPAEALRLASKALPFRRQLLGNMLKTCDSQHEVACMLHNDGHVNSALTVSPCYETKHLLDNS
ncbi:hypothetical protein VTI74DRAFT_10614 [Chaetomium olivicolor]